MEFTLYILVIVLVLIKIIIWSCVCYTRSRRLRAAQQRIIIVRGPQDTETRQDQHGIIHNEHIPSVQDTYGGITNPQLATFAPPSYDDVIRTPQEATKPPSYEQVIKEHQRIGASQEHGSK
ncbi:hypothetical protein CHS0354_024726 [Potamilus streckersoni]|uniref:Uncharacterized protein n=1 Tax=Potamilus streckersoni TaxID=2493646 RepID=A0AAE0VLF8_9BIVA|nr:hypothetical protein CHS0354_024726 [Potamilus streckersoni]